MEKAGGSSTPENVSQQSTFARAHLARREPGSQNVFERAMESREFINSSEELKPLVKLRRNTTIAAISGFLIVGAGTYAGLNKARPSFIHGKWVTAVSLGAGVFGGYVVSVLTAREGIRKMNEEKMAAARAKEALSDIHTGDIAIAGTRRY